MTLTNVLGAHIGGCSVIVSNSYGSVTSAIAPLRVIDPIITNHPGSLFVHAGQSAQFSVGVIGTPPSYCWRKDDLPLPGTTAALLLRTNVSWTDHGTYDVVVTNDFGALTSQVAVLTVNAAVADSFNPASGSVQALTLAPQADGGLLMGGYCSSMGATPPNYLLRRPSPRPIGTLIDVFTIDAGGTVEICPPATFGLFCWHFCWHFFMTLYIACLDERKPSAMLDQQHPKTTNSCVHCSFCSCPG